MASLRTLTLLALAAGFSCSRASDCSYFGLLNHLNLGTANAALGILRPVKNWTTTTLVQLDMILNGILDVNEKFQTVTNHIWINMVSLQRKPFLYIINLILPLLFLLFLDVASFFLCESSSEKVGFKVTILLSIFVLLLILKDILPSTEEALPVMAIYCVSVFTLVWINVLETMLMSFLNGLSCCVGEEANASEVFKVKTQQEADNPKESAGDAGAANPEASNPPLGPTDGGGLLKRILGKEKAALKPPERQEEDAGRTGCRWLRLVKIFDNVFFVLYFTTVVISQVFMFMLWNVPDLLG